METIDIKEMLNYFKNKISLIILITLLIGIVGCLYGIFIEVPLYKSSSTIVLVSDNSELTYNEVSLNKNLVSTYAEIVKSKRILNQVKNNLNLDYSYGDLYNKIEVSSVTNTEIIKITVTDTNKKNAKKIANETAKVFEDEIPELYSISNVNILDSAEEATTASNINIPKQTILFLMVGLVLGLGLVFVLYYFDRTVKSAEQIETKINLPVLGTVQDYKKGAK